MRTINPTQRIETNCSEHCSFFELVNRSFILDSSNVTMQFSCFAFCSQVEYHFRGIANFLNLSVRLRNIIAAKCSVREFYCILKSCKKLSVRIALV